MISIAATPNGAVFHSDAQELYRRVAPIVAHTLIFDPPWELISEFQFQHSDNVLAFCDGRRAGDVVRMFGAPAWVFTWDCVSCWFTPNRPLQRAKYCFWYGDVSRFNQGGYRIPGADRRPRVVRNSRSEYLFVPKPGRSLADVYSEPITKLHQWGHKHAKPVHWIASLISATARAGDVVLDPFCGGGSSVDAARLAKIPWIGGDIDIAACEMAARKISSAGPATDSHQQLRLIA